MSAPAIPPGPDNLARTTANSAIKLARFAPVITKRIVARIGDSRLNHDIDNYTTVTGSSPNINDYVSGPSATYVAGPSAKGIGTWLQALSYGQVSCPVYDHQYVATAGTQVAWTPTYLQAVGGTRTDAYKYQLDRLFALIDAGLPAPTECLMISGYNDVSISIGVLTDIPALFASMKANYIAAWGRLINRGIRPVVIVDTPAGWAYNSGTANQRRICHQMLRQWLRDNAESYGAWWYDAAKDLADPNSTVGDALASMYATDQPTVHPGPLGAMTIAQGLLSLFDEKGILSSPTYGQSLQDVYDSTYNLRGNRVRNSGQMLGSGGLSNGTNAPATGAIPDFWTARNNNGGTATITVTTQARPAGKGQGKDVKFVISATTDTEVWLYQDITVAPGDLLSYGVNMAVDASSGLDHFSVYMNELNSSSVTQQQCGAILGAGASSYGTGPSTFDARFETGKMLVSANGTTVRLIHLMYVNAGGSATVRFSNSVLRNNY